MRIARSIAVLTSLAVLGGCSSLDLCQGPSDIGDGGKSIPPLRVPVGLAEINTKEALRIPELNEPERPKTKGCLDQPPSYFPGRKPGAEAPAETRPQSEPAPAPAAEPPKPQT